MSALLAGHIAEPIRSRGFASGVVRGQIVATNRQDLTMIASFFAHPEGQRQCRAKMARGRVCSRLREPESVHKTH